MYKAYVGYTNKYHPMDVIYISSHLTPQSDCVLIFVYIDVKHGAAVMQVKFDLTIKVLSYYRIVFLQEIHT